MMTIDELLIDFDEMGFTPTTLCENPNEYACEWKKQLLAEIERLKAEYEKLQSNAEILARGVRDLNHENYELTEKIKQAKIDVLNELKTKAFDKDAFNGWAGSTFVVLVRDIDKMIEEYIK